MFVSQEEVVTYKQDGYLLVKDLFNQREVALLLKSIEASKRVTTSVAQSEDMSGKKAKLAIWHELGEDVWAAASSCPRIVNNIRILLGEEIAFFHGKVMFKEAKSGGAWEWHQDYGYWYDQGFAFPRLMSAFVALDPATSENGCLQVLRGSHKLGRLSHGQVGTQTGAELERVHKLEVLFERVSCEMSPGSVLFFDCNLLHTSASNDSASPRRSFIICYNALGNPQLNERKLASEVACPTSSDDAILRFAS